MCNSFRIPFAVCVGAILYVVSSPCSGFIHVPKFSLALKGAAPHLCNFHDGRDYYPSPRLSSSCLISLARNDIVSYDDYVKVDEEKKQSRGEKNDDDVDDHPPIGSHPFSINRRSSVGFIFASTTALLSNNISLASAQAMENMDEQAPSTITTMPNLKCLMDLPSSNLEEDGEYDVVRIYLCRHGQTENNRLHLVQGARVDPPLNDTGKRMAYRLGQALSNLPPTDTRTIQIGVHSYLQRAQQTAQVASQSLSSSPLSSTEPELAFIDAAMAGGYTQPAINERPLLKLKALPELGEVDFGPGNEGKPAAEVRGDMYTTFGAWAIGKIDTRPRSGEGETGREVLTRAGKALTDLALMASNNGGSIMAVSHSFYIRMMLSMIMEIPLAQSITLEQKNGCVNVLDVPIRKKDGEIKMKVLGPKSILFGPTSLAPIDFQLTIPDVKVIRLNENRHLTGLI